LLSRASTAALLIARFIQRGSRNLSFLGCSEQVQARRCWEVMKQVLIALASTAGLLVVAGCSAAPSYRSAPGYQSYVGPTEAPNALYGENYGPSYGERYEAPYAQYGAPYYGAPYNEAPDAENCTISNKHPSGASC